MSIKVNKETKITITVKDVDIELTEEEALSLYNILDGILGYPKKNTDQSDDYRKKYRENEGINPPIPSWLPPFTSKPYDIWLDTNTDTNTHTTSNYINPEDYREAKNLSNI